jgi:hypothetical protein
LADITSRATDAKHHLKLPNTFINSAPPTPQTPPGVTALGLTILLVRAARYLGAHPR